MAPAAMPVNFTQILKWEKPSRRMKKKNLADCFASAEKTGFVELYQLRGKLIAIFLHYVQLTPMVKGQRSLLFRYDPRHRAEAFRWVKKKIAEHRKDYNSMTETGVAEKDAALVPAFLANGFAQHSIILRGKTACALRGLMRAKNPPLQREGFEIRPLKASEISSVMKMQKRIFTRIPERGYYSHTPARLASDRLEYLSVMKDSRKGYIYGILREGELHGFFGLFIQGRSAGVGLNFDFPIQGQGFAQIAYRTMLEEMKRRRVLSFHGGTSQLAVLGLAKIMGREKISYLLRYKQQ
jgi:hypothetical protein